MAEQFRTTDRCTDERPPIKVICVGAGISGILTAIRLPQRIPNIELSIYEKNPDIGGTWFENTYPGLACDIPAAAYQLTFESNPRWTSYFASGAEIQQYWKHVAAKWDVYRYMKFGTEVVEARWNEQESLWYVKLKDIATGEIRTNSGNVLIAASGILNWWKWPDIPGLHDFKGHLVHTAKWNHSYDVTGKRVALIGGGSSGIQMLPEIQPKVKHCDHYMRGKTWIAYRVPGKEFPGQNPDDLENYDHTEEDKKKWSENPEEYLKFRAAAEDALNAPYQFIINGTEMQLQSEELFSSKMEERLAKKPEVFKAMKPDFAPACRRLTPGPGYLNAVVQDNVHFISTPIERVVENGILNDGIVREVDAIVCATGFDVSMSERYPTYGIGGVTLTEVWEPEPEAYLSMCPSKMPNYFMYLGPNGGPGTGSTLVFIEAITEYICKAVKKLQREGLKSMVPKDSAIKAFGAYIDEYMKGVVYSQNCRAWFKRNTADGRVVFLWPGGSMSAVQVFENPRWEDFDYEYGDDTRLNMWGWLGNGVTLNQREGKSTSGYLWTVDVPPVPSKRIEGKKKSDEAAVNGIEAGPVPKQLNGVVQVGILQQAGNVGATQTEAPVAEAEQVVGVNGIF